MTTQTETQKRIVELVEQARAVADDERKACCWEMALVMQPEISGQIRRAAKASAGSSRRWSDTDRDDMSQEVAVCVMNAARRIVDGKAHPKNPTGYLAGAVKIGIKDAQRVKTRDVMSAGGKRWRRDHDLEVPTDTKRKHDVKWEQLDEATTGDGEAQSPAKARLERDVELDARTAVLLKAVRTVYPKATVEDLPKYSAKILKNDANVEKLRNAMGKVAATDDVTPGEWAWDVEEEEARRANVPHGPVPVPTTTVSVTFTTLWGEEADPPKPKATQGTHPKKVAREPGMFDDEPQPPPEQGRDDGLER